MTEGKVCFFVTQDERARFFEITTREHDPLHPTEGRDVPIGHDDLCPVCIILQFALADQAMDSNG